MVDTSEGPLQGAWLLALVLVDLGGQFNPLSLLFWFGILEKIFIIFKFRFNFGFDVIGEGQMEYNFARLSHGLSCFHLRPALALVSLKLVPR